MGTCAQKKPKYRRWGRLGECENCGGERRKLRQCCTDTCQAEAATSGRRSEDYSDDIKADCKYSKKGDEWIVKYKDMDCFGSDGCESITRKKKKKCCNTI